jgi:hypothetical protein
VSAISLTIRATVGSTGISSRRPIGPEFAGMDGRQLRRPGGEAHDCPVGERLIRRVKPSKRMLGDKAYDSAELREDLHERGTKPIIPNRCNRKQPCMS